MSSRKHLITEHKTAILLVVVITVGGSIGTYFVIDYLNAQNPEHITLATTTSTYDSGLLDYLLPKFTDETGIQVKVLSVGTGAAIQIGKDGNTDVILVHSRSRENEFVNSSLGVNGLAYGIHRACIMFNDFIIIGHISNPANLKVGENITNVMTKLKNAIDAGNITFFSRGDNSGTHSKEKELWAEIGVISATKWSDQPNRYTETGQGMASTLLMTYEDNVGYTLIDRGTWLSFNDTYSTLTIQAESIIGENKLLNPYGAIPVNPVLHPHVKFLSAYRFVGFLTSSYGQDLIDSYKKNNVVLFHSSFGKNISCSAADNEVVIWSPFHEEFTGLDV